MRKLLDRFNSEKAGGSADAGRKSPFLQRLQTAVLSGVLLGLSFPKFDFHWLAWFALIPLLFVLLQPVSLRQAFGYALLSGTVFYALLLYWVVGVMHRYGHFPFPLAVLFYLGFATYNALFGAFFGLFARKILTQNYLFLKKFLPSPAQMALLNSFFIAALWVAIEFWQTHMLTGFPWCLLGYSLVEHLGILQLTTVTGIYGVSFLLCGVNVLLAHALYQKKRSLFVGTAVALGLLLTGDFAFRTWLMKNAPMAEEASNSPAAFSHRIAILQMNIPQDTEWTRPTLDHWLHVLDRMLQSSQAEIIIMPENPAPFYYPEDESFKQRLETMVRRSGSTVIAGVVLNHKDAQGHDGIYNSAITLAPEGQLIAAYDKQHRVPFGEYVPLRKYLSFAGKLTQEVSDFNAGEGYPLSVIHGSSSAIFICYEAIFPDLVRRFTKAGAQALINITNDGWYGDSSSPYQHFDMTRIRAIENRRYLIRAANTGISGVIDPYGRLLERTPWNRQVVLSSRIEYRTDQTFYVRFGDLFAWACVLLSGGFLVFVFVRKKVEA